jgi:hypothetical protein
VTEACFGTSDFRPFSRAELKTEFPEPHTLLHDIWSPADR